MSLFESNALFAYWSTLLIIILFWKTFALSKSLTDNADQYQRGILDRQLLTYHKQRVQKKHTIFIIRGYESQYE